MGSWNKTCGLTRLHIRAGEPVYVFALEESVSHERCYATAFWQPCLLPWTAEYNDYGAGENDKGVGLKPVMNGVAKQLIEMEQGENQFHDIPVKREGFDVELFYEAVHEGRLRRKGFMGTEGAIDYVMMRKECVDDILNSWELQDTKYNRETQDVEYSYYSYDDLVDEVPVLLAELKNEIDNMDEIKRIMFSFDRIEKTSTKYILGFLRGDSYRFSSFVNIKDTVMKLVEANKLEVADQLLQDYLKGMLINLLFEITRRNWGPGGHEGSQADDLDCQEMILDVTKEAIARERQWLEDDD